ncbi:hypothetical protein [Pedobacter nototheniae]|uniref:hypothetical protein n=1 Tax=Pedobacter nototheniae TaxID=2488994 RepID=UPI00292F1722|nr:hypothetical protein [Pedobacter nototheniae]
MNSTISKTILAVAFLLICNIYRVSAQAAPTPTTTGVNLFCQGSELTLPAPAGGEDWIVKYSPTQTTTPTTGITLAAGNKISSTDLKTGYYYLSSKSTAVGACESSMQEIPVYVLKPLVPAFTPAGFCVETPLPQVGTVTNPEDPAITTLAYQWYTVSGTTETIIAGATSLSYTPASPSVGTTTYRLKVGYVINGNKYCPQIVDHDVVITAKPGKPTITVGTANGTAAAVTF